MGVRMVEEDLVDPVPTKVYGVPVAEGIVSTEVIALEETKVVLDECSMEVCLEETLEVVLTLTLVDGCWVVDAELQSKPIELIPTLQEAFPAAAVWVWLAEE